MAFSYSQMLEFDRNKDTVLTLLSVCEVLLERLEARIVTGETGDQAAQAAKS